MSANRAYLDALRMLARRELSTSQVRQRLAKRDYGADAIEAALVRLKADQSLDDSRLAGAIARTEVHVRKHGQLRAQRRIEEAGIPPRVARRAVEEVFRDVDIDALMAGALLKRLRGEERIADDRAFARLYRYLVGQGFEADRVTALLRKHYRRP